jgi:hypothetical protein
MASFFEVSSIPTQPLHSCLLTLLCRHHMTFHRCFYISTLSNKGLGNDWAHYCGHLAFILRHPNRYCKHPLTLRFFGLIVIMSFISYLPVRHRIAPPQGPVAFSIFIIRMSAEMSVAFTLSLMRKSEFQRTRTISLLFLMG